jgi:hypothetical protein
VRTLPWLIVVMDISQFPLVIDNFIFFGILCLDDFVLVPPTDVVPDFSQCKVIQRALSFSCYGSINTVKSDGYFVSILCFGSPH